MKNEVEENNKMTTLVSVCNTLDGLGFTTQFKALEQGLKSLKTEQLYNHTEVKVVNFYRFEGESNPSDSSILYVIETTNGERGTLTDAYGPYSDTLITNFMRLVDEIEKKSHINK